MPRDGASGSALGKAIAVLETVIDRNGPVSVGALGMWLGLPKQTVHRIVGQLMEEGLLRRVPGSDGYFVGPRLRSLATRTLHRVIDDAPVHAVLEELVATLGETCNIGMLDGPEVVYLDRVECDWPLRMQLQPGSRVPVHCTAIGKMLLAMLEARARRRLVASLALKRYTDATITDPDALLAALKDIRRRGYAVNDQENTPGMMALAVPIVDADGRTLAALSVHAPVARLAPAAAIEKLPRLTAAAGRLSRLISFDTGD